MIIGTFHERKKSGLNSRGKVCPLHPPPSHPIHISLDLKNRQNQTKLIRDPHSSDDDVVELVEGYDEEMFGWCYIGSANLTPSAWGTVSGSGFMPILNVSVRFNLLVFLIVEIIAQSPSHLIPRSLAHVRPRSRITN